MAKTVAVITRTKDRPLLLGRALLSLAGQTLKDFVWVIVNDGGAQGPVDGVAKDARAKGIEILVMHNQTSTGMEAASNRGIRASASRFVVVHDDDDTWEPLFLEKTVGFLNSEKGVKYGGVITHAAVVRERMEKDGCKVLSKSPFNNVQTPAVYIADMAMTNQFPNLSFLYRREYFEKAGGYDETLPVLGDWDFNLRFLMHAEIAVIPELLANYHQRAQNLERIYDNTAGGAVRTHEEYDAIVRNRMLRRDIAANRAGIGYLVGFGRELQGANLARAMKGWLKGSRLGSVVARFLKL